jgi:hypothetical protein
MASARTPIQIDPVSHLIPIQIARVSHLTSIRVARVSYPAPIRVARVFHLTQVRIAMGCPWTRTRIAAAVPHTRISTPSQVAAVFPRIPTSIRRVGASVFPRVPVRSRAGVFLRIRPSICRGTGLAFLPIPAGIGPRPCAGSLLTRTSSLSRGVVDSLLNLTASLEPAAAASRRMRMSSRGNGRAFRQIWTPACGLGGRVLQLRSRGAGGGAPLMTLRRAVMVL